MTEIHGNRSRWGRLLGIGSLAALLVAGAWGLKARAVGAGWHGSDGPRAERLRRHFEHALEHALDRVDASDAQRESIRGIAEQAHDALLELSDGDREATREAFTLGLLGPEVDRETLERMRAEGLARAESASQILVAALADVAEVLTPEQRAELAEMSGDPWHGWRRWHR